MGDRLPFDLGNEYRRAVRRGAGDLTFDESEAERRDEGLRILREQLIETYASLRAAGVSAEECLAYLAEDA